LASQLPLASRALVQQLRGRGLFFARSAFYSFDLHANRDLTPGSQIGNLIAALPASNPLGKCAQFHHQ